MTTQLTPETIATIRTTLQAARVQAEQAVQHGSPLRLEAARASLSSIVAAQREFEAAAPVDLFIPPIE